MTTIYKCDTCGREFKSPKECKMCEVSHMSTVDRIKCLIMFNCGNVCDYCDNSYYVYGCEQDCEYNDCRHSNNYKDFIPTDPLHDKSRDGV
jgi:hypothetical protein